MICTVHVGNTHTAAAVWNSTRSRRPIQSHSFRSNDPALIFDRLKRCKTAQFVISGVVPKLKQSLISKLKRAGAEVTVFRADLVPHIRIVPSPPKSVGDDRIAAALGALSIDPESNWIVIDAGTAMTVNAVTPAKSKQTPTFHGGAIVPGSEMSLRALHEFTAQLPRLKALDSGLKGYLGHNTRQAMQLGSFYAQLGAALLLARGQMSDLTIDARIAVTGGGATSRFIRGLELYFPRAKIHADEFLVQRGLLAAWMQAKKMAKT